MCGIAGMYLRSGKPVDAAALVRMTRTLTHRGPDEEGYWVNGGTIPDAVAGSAPFVDRDPGGAPAPGNGHVGLGHRRLSIIDLASGRQPLSNEDGSVWVTFNGEIYNFRHLAAELEGKGHRFRTHCDTEAIVHAYEEWGTEAIARLRGMFAFAIWDERRQRMILARDRAGKKPLYYRIDDESLVFGSELKSILTGWRCSREIDPTALSDYLSLLYVPSPGTIFRDIRKLPAAHYAVVDARTCAVHPYWDLDFRSAAPADPERIERELVDRLDEATRMRMVSDVPLGAFLSGGVDSSAVVGLMAGASKDPVVTSSIAFSVSQYDESAHAESVAKRFKTDHNVYRVTPETVAVVERLAWNYDEPFADSSAIPTYYVSKTARERVTVALSGDGGDENFAGYRRYRFDLRENAVRNLLPGSLGRAVFGALGRLYPKADYLPQVFRGKTFLSNVARDPVEAYCFSMSAFWEDDKRRLLRDDVVDALGDHRTADGFRDLYGRAPADDHLSRILYLDIKTYLCEDILTKVDRASMAVSLEVRCPILDHELMEYAARIPSSLKLCGGEGKHVFKRALRGLLPDDILYRSKMGFGVPIAEWLRGELAEYARDRILEGPATDRLLRRERVEQLWKEHRGGLRNRGTELWILLMLNLWWKNFVETDLHDAAAHEPAPRSTP